MGKLILIAITVAVLVVAMGKRMMSGAGKPANDTTLWLEFLDEEIDEAARKDEGARLDFLISIREKWEQREQERRKADAA